MSKSEIKKLVVVHPHKEFDSALKCQKYIKKSIKHFEGADTDIMVVQGFKEDSWHNITGIELPFYISIKRNYRLITSPGGKIRKEDFQEFIQNNAVIKLLGGIIGQCHQSAFCSIVKYIQKNDIHNVKIEIPFDGCYFQHGSRTWGLNDEHRFDGIFMGGYGFEMTGNESYSLREVVTKTYGELSEKPKLFRLQLKNSKGEPIPANDKTIRKNILDYFFHHYFVTPNNEKIVKREYKIDITNDALIIFIY